MSTDLYDVAIVGAGPAGTTAAIMLAQEERRVVLIDRNTFPRKPILLGWLNARVASLLAQLGVAAKPLLGQRIKEVKFHAADFSKSANPQFEGSPGYVIDRVALDNALVACAVDSGVTLMEGCEASAVDLKESSAIVKLRDGRGVEGKLLILASGRGSALVERAGFPRVSSAHLVWTAQVDAPLKPGSGPSSARIGVVLGLDKGGSFGLFCVSKSRVCVAMNWTHGPDNAVPALVNLCQAAYSHKALPVDLTAAAAAAEPLPSPASVALDLESHVGKHTLLIGDAGGFVSAISNEGIFPAMWSAQIAAGVAQTALRSVHSQDALMTFDSQWRIEMADYLRPPNTDNQFLLPLIFSNQPMADRMGAAFFSGDNI
jgi:flavin-dependent dehydrogenase